MIRKYTLLFCLGTGIFELGAQFQGFKNKGQFYGQLQTHALFCQIDGDGAAGYHKLGYQLQGLVGLALNNTEAVEWSLGLAERGARKGIDPEQNDFEIFHIRHQWLESGLYYARSVQGFVAHAGLRIGYLLSAEESEGFAPKLEEGMRKLHTFLELGLRYPLNEQWSIGVNGSYSVYSLLKNDPGIALPPTLYRSSGQFSNTLGIGIIFTP
jgi:hypothetical protein